MKTSRRTFVKALLGAGAGAAAPPVARLAEAWAAQHPGPRAKKQRRWVMVIDLAACDGCKKCTEACRREHFVPFEQEWIKVLEVGNNEYEHHNFPRPCMQCENAPCVKVCPVGATYHNSEGIVLIRVNLSAPTLYVFRCDRPVPAGLDELTEVIRRLADQPQAVVPESRPLEARA